MRLQKYTKNPILHNVSIVDSYYLLVTGWVHLPKAETVECLSH